MAKNSHIVRLFSVLHAMTQAKRGVVLKQLADRRGWPLRALYRDMKALADAGVPVGHEHGRYWLVDGWPRPTASGPSPRDATTPVDNAASEATRIHRQHVEAAALGTVVQATHGISRSEESGAARGLEELPRRRRGAARTNKREG